MKTPSLWISLIILAPILSSCNKLGWLVGCSDTGEGMTHARPDIAIIGSQLALYKARNKSLPTTEQGIAALVEKPKRAPVPENWVPLLTVVPLDPWGHEYVYRVPAIRSSLPFDLYSLGPDGKDGTADDVGNWEIK